MIIREVKESDLDGLLNCICTCMKRKPNFTKKQRSLWREILLDEITIY